MNVDELEDIRMAAEEGFYAYARSRKTVKLYLLCKMAPSHGL